MHWEWYGELKELTATMVNRWTVKQFHWCFTGFFTKFVSEFKQKFHRQNGEKFSPVFHRLTGDEFPTLTEKEEGDREMKNVHERATVSAR